MEHDDLYTNMTEEELQLCKQKELQMLFRIEREIRKRSKWEKFRREIHLIMTDPFHSWLSLIVVSIIYIVIILSIAALIVESYKIFQVHNTWVHSIWFLIDTGFVTFFILEYSIRLVTCQNPLRFIIDPLNIIDILAIGTYFFLSIFYLYWRSVPEGLEVIRVLRILRLFRILRYGHFSNYFRAVYRAMRASLEAMLMLLIFLLVGVIFFSTLVYYAEISGECLTRDVDGIPFCDWWDDDAQRPPWYAQDDVLWFYDDDNAHARERSYFQNIPETFYWCVVTMSTVGYGDTVPRTTWGKIVGAFTMIVGIIIIAFPTGVLSVKFIRALRKELEEAQDIEMLRTHKYATAKQRLKMLRNRSVTYVRLLTTLREKIDSLMEIELDTLAAIDIEVKSWDESVDAEETDS